LTKFIKRFIPNKLWKQLRRTKEASTGAYYRSLASHLMSHAGDDTTGLTYFFETQPYSVEQVIRGHLMGIFASTSFQDGYVRWNDPQIRGILPIQDFHVPRKLRKLLRHEQFDVRVDTDFRCVMEKCSEQREGNVTHITPQFMDIHMQLFEMGLAHCVSVWQDGTIVGGRFGIAIGAYFSGESSFHRLPEVGKVSLIRLAEILVAGGFLLRDTRWPTSHMAQFGGHGISRAEFHQRHIKAITTPAHFDPTAPAVFTPI
jgi:leucyl/phenylalanyl-tRNA---protein transferase